MVIINDCRKIFFFGIINKINFSQIIYFAHTVYCCPYDSENVKRKERR